VDAKKSIYKHHLSTRFGSLRVSDIDESLIARVRADLIRREYPEKTINNILAVLSKALRYAEDARLIDRAPKVGMFKIEEPEIEWWELPEYVTLLRAAREEGPFWYVAVCLAGEAGLRVGEIRALDWQRDVELTVNAQRGKGVEGTPKGRNRRTVPMTSTLYEALRSLEVVRRGYVVRTPDGLMVTDAQCSHAIERIHKRAGLKIRYWHPLRHAFATHAAMFGVSPWTLRTWLGHKTVVQTEHYAHVASAHARQIPDSILAAGAAETDPTRRVLAMLGARRAVAECQQSANDRTAISDSSGGTAT
jgi:integrase